MEVEIVEKSKYLYSVEFKNENPKNEILLKALLESKILGAGTTITTNFKKINFNATSVTTLKEKNKATLSYIEANEMFDSLQEQIEYLEKKKHTFYNFSLEDVIVVTKNNKKIFFCANTDHLLVIKNQLITFDHPFDKKSGFLNPEIKKLDRLPSHANSESILYTLGKLCLYCLFQEIENEAQERKLEQIKYTPLYWKVKQCLK